MMESSKSYRVYDNINGPKVLVEYSENRTAWSNNDILKALQDAAEWERQQFEHANAAPASTILRQSPPQSRTF